MLGRDSLTTDVQLQSAELQRVAEALDRVAISNQKVSQTTSALKKVYKAAAIVKAAYTAATVLLGKSKIAVVEKAGLLKVALTAFTGATAAATAIQKGFTKANASAKTAATLLAAKQLTVAEAATVLKGREVALMMTRKGLAIKTKLATAAQWLWNAAMKANPVGAVITGVVALGAAIGGLIGWLTRSREATTEAGKSISDLAEYYGRSTEQIEADMERMGTTCLDVWEAQEQGIRALAEEIGVSTDEIRDRMEQMGITCIEVFAAQEESLQSLSDKWGICSDQIREEIAGLVEELGCREAAMATWEAQQYEMLQGIAEEWNMCTSEILAQMQEQGISAEQWASQMGQAWDSFQADVARNVDDIVNGFRRIPEEMLHKVKATLCRVAEMLRFSRPIVCS